MIETLNHKDRSNRSQMFSKIGALKTFAKFTRKHFFFFYQDFLSQTLTTHRTAGEGRGYQKTLFFFLSGFSFTDTDDSQDCRGREGRPSFIPLYHFHPLTNIQTFICNFACEMTSHIFNRTACIYQTATR